MRHFIYFVTLSLATLLVTVVFQNCAEPIAEDRNLASVANGAPFAYDTKVDHIAYMSCSEMSTYDPGTYFTFKVGGYNDGSGVKLTSEYIYATRNLPSSDKATALAQSPLNGPAYPQLGLRETTNLQALLSAKPCSTCTAQPIYGDYWGPYSQTDIAPELIRNNGGSHIRLHPSTSAIFEDQVSYVLGENNASIIRQNVSTSGSYYLSLAYAKGTGNNAHEAVSSPAGSKTTAYGLGYKLGFKNPTGTTKTPYLLASVAEHNLTTQQSTNTTWDCSANWAFQIVHPDDVGIKVVCEMSAATMTPENATQTEMLKIIRNILPADKWDVNLDSRCIIPKNATGSKCYGNKDPLLDRKYVNPALCDPAKSDCPHYVSICKKR